MLILIKLNGEWLLCDELDFNVLQGYHGFMKQDFVFFTQENSFVEFCGSIELHPDELKLISMAMLRPILTGEKEVQSHG